jgi:hypothetical protein
MKKIITLMLVAAVMPCFAGGLNKNLKLDTAETFVQLYPRDGFLHIKEYSLGATSSRCSIKKIKALVEDAEYCRSKFKFDHFTAMEESMKKDRGYITGEYNLMTRETNLVKMMEDGFGKVLDRKVEVSINDGKIGLYYDGEDIQVRSNNAEGAYANGEKRVIFWKNGLQYFEAVFAGISGKTGKSIVASFGADVASPEMSQAEIDEWKNKKSLVEKMDVGYQHDADIFRLRHLQYYRELIEAYYQKTGSYPLQGASEVQNYVYLAAPQQKKYVQGVPPQSHEVTGVEAFRKELENGLGRKVDLKFDPQKVPTGAPNFYIYMMDGDSFYLAVHLYNERSFSNPVAKHYHKLEITNGETGRQGLWNPDDLMEDSAFITALSETPDKNGWFLHLEEKYK